MRSISIIIPVYNANREFEDCLSSIIKFTDLDTNTLIIVNDKSDDADLLNYLDNLSTITNVQIINNDSNLGFVKSCNIGMRLSKNDVILLNSDTLVTKGWLEKLQRAAYSNDKVATVTPLTNNGTIASVPNFVEDNSVPENYTVDSFADLIERISLNKYPEIPTAVGFCMYIKRDVINEIGLFNEKLFGKGYGEENDFCLRARKAGWINILDDVTYIFHAGSTSFTNKIRKQQVAKHLKVIERLYPGYQKSISDFVISNPLADIHKNIQFWLSCVPNPDSRYRILFVMHYEPTVGGVGLHTTDLASKIKNSASFKISPDQDGCLVIRIYESGEWRFLLKLDGYDSTSLAEKFRYLLLYFKINIIHVQHLLGIPETLLKQATELEIPILHTLHDYYLVSSSPQLIGEYTNIHVFSDNPNIDAEAVMHYSSSKNSPLYTRLYSLSNMIDIFIAPSTYVLDFFQALKISKAKLKLISNGVEYITQRNRRHQSDSKDTLNIAYLGVQSDHKGLPFFLEAVSELKKCKSRANYFSIGASNDKYSKILLKLGVLDLGGYSRSSISKILNKNEIDLVLIPSIYPETYSYTLSESAVSGIPVVARKIGALSERVNQMNCGWLFQNMRELTELVLRLERNKQLIAKKRTQIDTSSVISVGKMASEYVGLYESLLNTDEIALDNEGKRYKMNNFMFKLINNQNNSITKNSKRSIKDFLLSYYPSRKIYSILSDTKNGILSEINLRH